MLIHLWLLNKDNGAANHRHYNGAGARVGKALFKSCNDIWFFCWAILSKPIQK